MDSDSEHYENRLLLENEEHLRRFKIIDDEDFLILHCNFLIFYLKFF